MGNSKTERITGEIVNIIYQNEENGYKVAEVETDDDLIVAVGYLEGVSEGETVILTGSWIKHAVYGEQFKAEMYEKQVPKSESAILRYLGSGIIKGIRESTAKKIVDMFGEKALEVIENDPLSLTKIKGISSDKAIKIQQGYIDQLGASTLVMFLQNYDVSIKFAAKVYKRFGSNAATLIKENPYILCDEIDGIGFKTADGIAMKMGMEIGNEFRIKAGTVYAQRYNTQFGHTFLPRNTLIEISARLLNVSPGDVDNAIEGLIIERRFINQIIDGIERIYYFTHYYAEKYIAKRLLEINAVQYEVNRDDIKNQISAIENHQKFPLADKQKDAVISAMECGALVITGGPGTGKTTIINTIIKIMHSNGYSVTLTAPTGRAAKRMSQLCSIEAKTIHRLLEAGYADGDDDIQFQINEGSPIQSDVIIVDEMSMVDIILMDSLLKAIKHGTRLIMVGDINQLPSVGPGNVLSDIIESGKINVIRLTEIFRQAEQSMIVVNAHRINDGMMPICNQKDKDFFFASYSDPSMGAEYILELCRDRLPNKYNVEPFDIQVISPTKKGVVGVGNLNTILQEALNPKGPDKKEKTFGFITFREGDKVMQMKNNYDLEWTSRSELQDGKGVFNGDVGYIESINDSFKTVTVVFDDRKVNYEYKYLEELDLAYCVTVHKSQGSEFPIVVIPVYEAPYMLLNRNLFYTAVTRAKSLVVLVGKNEIVKKMVDNDRETTRYSSLKDNIIGDDSFNDEIIF